MRATSTLTSGARILAATRLGRQRHVRPYSIKSRDKAAIATASAGRANLNDTSKLVMKCAPNLLRIIAQNTQSRSFNFAPSEKTLLHRAVDNFCLPAQQSTTFHNLVDRLRPRPGDGIERSFRRQSRSGDLQLLGDARALTAQRV